MPTYRLTGNDDWDAAMRAEYRQDRYAGKLFARACRDGDADLLAIAAGAMNESFDGWRLGFRAIARAGTVHADTPRQFLPIWIEHKALPRRIGHRPTTAAGLRLLMPGARVDGPVLLYRGTTASERRKQLYGFSWSTDPEIARRFAEERALALDAVVLVTLAPPRAVLLLREDEGYYDEREAVVDPYALDAVAIHARIKSARS